MRVHLGPEALLADDREDLAYLRRVSACLAVEVAFENCAVAPRTALVAVFDLHDFDKRDGDFLQTFRLSVERTCHVGCSLLRYVRLDRCGCRDDSLPKQGAQFELSEVIPPNRSA